MMSETPAPGKTTIAPDVLLSVAKLTALDVDGVARLSMRPSGVNRLLQRRNQHADNGVKIVIEEDQVTIDLYIILEKDVNIRQTSRTIQKNVTRAITDMVGMDVGDVNIHIEDIDFDEEEE